MKIVIRNLSEIAGAFNQLEKSIQPTLMEATEKAVLYIQSNLPDYPPEPPLSSYRRTLQLFRSLTRMQGQNPNALSRVEKGLLAGVRGFIGTNLEYAQWVIDEDYQAWFHEDNGWWVLQDVVHEQEEAITDIYDEAIDNILGKLGFL
jgi:hypothetical protein